MEVWNHTPGRESSVNHRNGQILWCRLKCVALAYFC